MKNFENSSQEDINHIWDERWRTEDGLPVRAKFKQRLFIEGYPVFMQYVPIGAKNFLEVGAGSGRYGLKLAEDRPQLSVTLTDIVEEGLLSMRTSVVQLGLANVTVQKEDAFKLSFSDGTFDVVFSDAVIQHLPDHENAVKEMLRVVRPGGLLIISSVNGWNAPHQLYKAFLALLGKQYPYGHEKNFTPMELRSLFQRLHIRDMARDGFYPAYGIYRLKTYWKPFALVGKILNRINKLIDPITGRFLSRHFGFEIFVVARKK
jgi:SAM-dependent methyltransferase